MALDIFDQIKSQCEKAQTILICFAEDATGDSISAALAFKTFLEKQNKKVDIVSDEFNAPKRLSFLEEINSIHGKMKSLKKFVVSIDMKGTEVEELSYDFHNNKLRIFITPEEGFITEKHMETAETSFVYDLIISFGTKDLKSLGDVYHKHKELFSEVALINIDSHVENESYGHINYTDITATASSELLFKILKKYNKNDIDKNIATMLLTGIIAKTRSFQAEKTRPHTLKLASDLMELGADRDLIIKNLYQTRSLSTLKLWGRALEHMKHDKSNNFVWTSITREDFVRTGTNEYDLHDIIDELIQNSPEAHVVLLMYENEYHHKNAPIHAILCTKKPYDAAMLVGEFGPLIGGKNRVSFTINKKSLLEVEKTLTDHITKGMKAFK